MSKRVPLPTHYSHFWKKLNGLDKVVVTHVVLLGLPTILYYCLRLGGLSLNRLYIGIATIYLISSLIVMLETTVALFRRFSTRQMPPRQRLPRLIQSLKFKLGLGGARLSPIQPPLPRCSFIVAAYLPNEQNIILSTLEHILLTVPRPEDGLELILAYNTPVSLPIENDLHRLAKLYPELRLHRVEDSQSKAENINAALEVVTGEITCILDADHHPAADCFVRAWRWLRCGYDVVQGRNVIRNHNCNALTRIIAIEFESIYGISHPAKSFLADTALFGGSNGYWRTSVLQKIRFNPIRLTEDIDASSRTLLQGYRIIHDRSIITTELAPTHFQAFWTQRKRWAQGWLEVSLKYQRRFWKSNHLNFWQKAYWTHLLYFREVYPFLAIQIFPIIFSAFLYQGSVSINPHGYSWITLQIAFFGGLYKTLAIMRTSFVKYPLWYFIHNAVFAMFYTTFKNMIAIVAVYDHLHQRTQWVVTPRSRTKTAIPKTTAVKPLVAVPTGRSGSRLD